MSGKSAGMSELLTNGSFVLVEISRLVPPSEACLHAHHVTCEPAQVQTERLSDRVGETVYGSPGAFPQGSCGAESSRGAVWGEERISSLRVKKRYARRDLAIGAVGGMPTTSSFIESQVNRLETESSRVAYIREPSFLVEGNKIPWARAPALEALAADPGLGGDVL